MVILNVLENFVNKMKINKMLYKFNNLMIKMKQQFNPNNYHKIL